MQLITKETDYAVRALLNLLKQKGEYISARQLAKEENIPYPFLRRIIGVLKDNKLIESKEGAGGGVRVLSWTDIIRMSEIISIFQGDIQLSSCMFRKTACSNRTGCVIRNRLKGIESIVQKELNSITLASLRAEQEEEEII